MLLRTIVLKHTLKINGFTDVPDISVDALIAYKERVRKNSDKDGFYLYKKLLRNWLCAPTVYIDDDIEKRCYYNLTLTLDRNTNTIFRIYNHYRTLRDHSYDDEIRSELNEILKLN